MTYHSRTQDFCRSVEESYAFDNQVVGLEKLAQGAIVAEVSPEELSDSGRFKRSELKARLDEEPEKSMTFYTASPDILTSHVLEEDGFVYSTSLPPASAEGCYIFRPLPASERERTREEKRRLLHAA